MIHRLRLSRRNQTTSRKGSTSRRRLSLQSLESRRMMASDWCGVMTETPPQDAEIIAASLSQEVRIEMTATAASDAAGSTLSTAADLGVVQGTMSRLGQLSQSDRLDVVRFEVLDDSHIDLTLDHLTRNADLYLLNRNGKKLASSKLSGTSTDSIRGKLIAGEYFLVIAARSTRTTWYHINFDVESLTPPIPIAPTPIAPTTTENDTIVPAVETAPEAESPIEVLPEVDYFGSANDWNLNTISAPEAWAAGSTGQGITVAVIDTGVDLDHPELQHSLFVNPGEIPDNGLDDDHNGYVDDVSGYDFVDLDAVADDGNGHGTHVAGTIAAANDGIGSTGVAPGATILPVRVLDDSGRGTDATVAAGIRYAADLGAQIINLSLGGTASAKIADAIEYATSLGSFVVAAAGNESASVPSYPAQSSSQLGGVISVGAFDSSGQVASFSNRVGDSGAVQVDSPGVQIYSTYLDGRYATMSGTSMAAPHVAGVAALVLSAAPNLTAPQLRNVLVTGALNQTQLSTLYTIPLAKKVSGTFLEA
ncbi:hypothetical protein CGZ80_06240 [Rhodopirellula sp. MGV]|nr:hypothetical protein CGZ80_06240 [Rhodopirellula sp. MGV]